MRSPSLASPAGGSRDRYATILGISNLTYLQDGRVGCISRSADVDGMLEPSVQPLDRLIVRVMAKITKDFAFRTVRGFAITKTKGSRVRL